MRLFDKLKSRMHLEKVRLWTTMTIHSEWTQDHQSVAIYSIISWVNLEVNNNSAKEPGQGTSVSAI